MNAKISNNSTLNSDRISSFAMVIYFLISIFRTPKLFEIFQRYSYIEFIKRSFFSSLILRTSIFVLLLTYSS